MYLRYLCIVDKMIDQVWLIIMYPVTICTKINTRWQGGRQKMFIGGKKTFRVVPSIISADRKPISLISPLSHHPLHQKTDSVSHTLYSVPSHPNHQHATSINVFKDPKRGRTSRPRNQFMRIWCNDCLPLSRSLSTGLGSTDYWRDDKYRHKTSSVRYGVV